MHQAARERHNRAIGILLSEEREGMGAGEGEALPEFWKRRRAASRTF